MNAFSSQESVAIKEQPVSVEAVRIRYAIPIVCARFVATILSVITLAFSVTALDRSLTTSDYFFDEVLMIAAPSLFLLIIQLHPVLTSVSGEKTHRQLILSITSAALVLVWVSWIVAAVRIGHGVGACAGPAKVGVFDNLRDCRRLEAGTIVAAINSVVGSALVGLHFA